jgi:hypothetical protein
MADPSWAEIIRGAIENALDGVHTTVPARVKSYLAPIQQVSVEPVIKGMPALEDVPVLWPRGGGAFLHFPLTVGDHVLLIFCEADFSPWRLSGSAQAPALLRRHGLFAYAIPGASPDIAPLVYPAVLSGAAFGEDAGTIVQVASGVAKVGLAVGPGLPVTQEVALAARVAEACSAAVAEALPTDGGKAAFAAFATAFAGGTSGSAVLGVTS